MEFVLPPTCAFARPGYGPTGPLAYGKRLGYQFLALKANRLQHFHARSTFLQDLSSDTFGGVERTIHAIAKGSAAHGIETDVLSLSRSPSQNTCRFDGHMAHKAKLDLEFASTGFSREAFTLFRQLSAKADIIHYHFPWPSWTWCISPRRRENRHWSPTIQTS